jgi:hypothetical protein
MPQRRYALVLLSGILGAGRAAAQPPQTKPPTPPAAPTPAPAPGPNQSLIAPLGPVDYARKAQADFEKVRLQNLGFSSGGAYAEPDVQFGSIFYWNNNNDVPPRPETPEVGVARKRLLQTLAEAAQSAPSDDWVPGQRVRYSIEAKDLAAAAAAVSECRGTNWWCNALSGLVKHEQNDAPGAERAFNLALSQMSDTQRCEWQNIAPWLKKADSLAYLAKNCTDRVAFNTRLFWIGKPFAHLDGNDLRNELLARYTFNRIDSQGMTPYGPWKPEFGESQFRYGWPVAWSTQNTIVNRQGGMVSSTIGHEATPSHDFIPSSKALADPFTATPEDFPFNARYAQMRYHTRYSAGGFQELGGQFVRFLRGDSTLLVGAYVMDGKARYERGKARAALVLERGPTERVSRTVLEGMPLRGGVSTIAPAFRDTLLASIELLSNTRKFAGRYRTGVTALPANSMLSDMLLLAVRATDAAGAGLAGLATLESVLPSALGGTDIGDGQSFGVYWEYYGGPGATVTISIAPTDTVGGFRRLGSLFRGGGRDGGASLRIPDPAQPDGGPGRRLTLTMPEAKPGRYRLSIEVTSPGAPAARRDLIIRVPEPPPARLR